MRAIGSRAAARAQRCARCSGRRNFSAADRERCVLQIFTNRNRCLVRWRVSLVLGDNSLVRAKHCRYSPSTSDALRVSARRPHARMPRVAAREQRRASYRPSAIEKSLEKYLSFFISNCLPYSAGNCFAMQISSTNKRAVRTDASCVRTRREESLTAQFIDRN